MVVRTVVPSSGDDRKELRTRATVKQQAQIQLERRQIITELPLRTFGELLRGLDLDDDALLHQHIGAVEPVGLVLEVNRNRVFPIHWQALLAQDDFEGPGRDGLEESKATLIVDIKEAPMMAALTSA